MKFVYVIRRDVSDFEQFTGLDAQLLLGASLVKDNVSLFVTLASGLLQLGSSHRQIVFGAVELLRRGLQSSPRQSKINFALKFKFKKKNVRGKKEIDTYV